MPPLKRKIAAILAADVAGYSRLIAEDEEQTLTRLRDYQAAFKDCIQQAGGRVFKTAGDSVLAEFPSAVDALRCAITVQETLRVRNQAYPMSRQMAYRVGLTIGDVVDQDGDLLGDGVNIAARLEALAQPGGICISKALHDAVASKISAKFVDMGPQQVKNIPIPVHVYSVTPDPRAAANTADDDVSGTSTGSGAPPRASAAAKDGRWQPPFALTALAVAGLGAVLAYALPRLLEQQPTAPAVATAPAAAPESTKAAAPGTKTAAVAPADPAPPATVSTDAPAPPAAAGTPQMIEDPVAAQKLRPIRWSQCNDEDTDAAIRSCTGLITDLSVTGDDLAKAQRRLGYALRKRGDVDAALVALGDSLKTAPSAAGHNDRGITYLLKGQFNEALADFNDATRLDTKLGDAWNNRAWTLFKLNRHKDALADANKAVDLIADKAYVWDTRGHIHEALADRKAAEGDFIKALSLDTDLATSRAGLKRVTGR